jgi:signal transduction histidine kinase
MTKLLRALLVEDSDKDAQLLLRELRQNGYMVDHERVETREAMVRALSDKTWDVILCDYTLPQFNAMNALAVLQESGLQIPFLVVSGTIDEETAVTLLQAGADDFLVKGRFARLAPAIERSIQASEARRLRKEVETERANLTSNLEAVNAELQHILYTAFHDLRSPLVTIKGFLGMLKQDLQTERRDRIQVDMEYLEASTDKMEKVLSVSLKFAKFGTVRHAWETVVLRELTQETIQRLEATLQSKNIAVTISPELPRLYGDRLYLGELLKGLIENAARYLNGQRDPHIEIGVRQQDNQQIIFVRDNGPGIDPRYHNRIFNLFEKLDPMTEGSGIGLALAKRVVEMHGGKIWVESVGEGQGSTFCFTIPTR